MLARDPLTAPPNPSRRYRAAAAAILAFCAGLALLPGALAQDSTTFRDERGRTIGRSETRDGRTRLYDQHGRHLGTVERGSVGTLRLRDRYGRPAGTVTPSPRR